MSAESPAAISRYSVLVFSITCYVLALASFGYLIGFVADLLVPRSVSHGEGLPASWAVPVNLALIALFGVQHSVMARGRFKAWLGRLFPPGVHRSLFVLATVVVLWVMFVLWQPISRPLWDTSGSSAWFALRAGELLGWAFTLFAVRLIDDRELFGLRQAFAHFRGEDPSPIPMVTPSLYKYVRHPIYLGFLAAFWCAPTMTLGRLLFAAGMSGYILVGIRLEERDLIHHFGERYRAYRERVGMLLPRLPGVRPGTRRDNP